MITLLAVLVGGFAGAVARQELFSAVQDRAHTRFPVGILVVNLSGAFVLGLLYGLSVESLWPRWLATGVQTGLIGAYTTYSTWAVDSLALARGAAGREAVLNLMGSLLAGVLLVWAGVSIGSVMLRPDAGRGNCRNPVIWAAGLVQTVHELGRRRSGYLRIANAVGMRGHRVTHYSRRVHLQRL